jgi:hypothetical protein
MKLLKALVNAGELVFVCGAALLGARRAGRAALDFLETLQQREPAE